MTEAVPKQGKHQGADCASPSPCRSSLAPPVEPPLRLWIMLIAIAALSQLHRNSLGVVAPDLTRDLSMSPSTFGTVGSIFFIATSISQLPVGILFDRIGPRLTVPCFASLAALGVAAQALAQNGEQFAAARFLLGIGSSVNWMGAVALCAVWYPPDRFSTRLSWIYAFGQTGTFLAATPLAVVSGNVGWRWAFAAMAVLTAVIGALFWICVRDAPTDHPAPKRSSRDFHDMLGGLVQVWRTPGLLPVLAMNAVATAMIATILGLWAGPYLADVYGLDATARGNVLLAMAIAHLLGSLAFGPLDRIFDTRKWVVVSGAAGTILVLIGLASISKPPFWLAVSLLVLLCFVTAYSVIIMAHGRSLFAPDMLGRGLTLINFAPIVGLVGLPIVTGAIIQAFPAQGMARPAIAYQCSFAVMALALAAGLLCYLKSKDIKPGRILR